MILNLPSKDEFVSRFLKPVNNINNSCILNITKSGIESILSTEDHAVVLHAVYNKKLDIEEPVEINIPDITRLSKILDCIPTDNIDLEINDNNIQYKSTDVRFKYHLLEKGILSAPAINVSKISQIEYDTHFKMTYASLISLIKSASFTLDINKVYISCQDDGVFAEVDDKQSHNVDSIRLKICNSFKGSPINDPLPVSFETIRTLASSRCDEIDVSVNSKLNVMTFIINNSDIETTYIISGLAK